MERKIGEIFEYNGEWYQVVECDSCGECSLRTTECGSGTKSDLADEVFGECSKVRRSDSRHAIFKKLEKVGEPYTARNRSTGRTIHFQRYKCYQKPIIEGNIVWHWPDDNFIDIEIKQKQEDMKEKNLNLKPFDLEAAKAGKPVCTRDGRKARIICFDAEGNKPLIVLSKIDGKEVILRYTEKGQSDNFHSPTPREDDLMMLPEKKEGWVVVSRNEGGYTFVDNNIFDNEESADRFNPAGVKKIAVTKIEWGGIGLLY